MKRFVSHFLPNLQRSAFVSLAALVLMVGVASAAAMNYRAHLSGRFSVPAIVDTNAEGQATFKFNDDGSISYKLNVANIENVRMAHIHLLPGNGYPQPLGPILVWLYPSKPPFVTIPGRFEGVLAKGKITAGDLAFGQIAGLTMEQLKAYIEGGLTYVNVHTDQYPAGEIHGKVH